MSELRVLVRRGRDPLSPVGHLGHEWGKGFWRCARALDGEQTRCSNDGDPGQNIRVQGRVSWVGVGPRWEGGVLENQSGEIEQRSERSLLRSERLHDRYVRHWNIRKYIYAQTFQPFTSAVARKIRAGVHTERVIATAHPAERASSQRCTANGVAALAGRGLGFYLGRAEPARDAR